MKIKHYPKFLTVEELRSPLRIDTYLSHILSELSRNEISKYLKEGKIKIKGKQVKPSHLLKGKEEITLNLKIPTIGEKTIVPLNLIPEPEILYENQDLLVINKPAGVNTHPTLKNINEPSIASWFCYRYPQAKKVGEDKLRPGIVHRLDKDTSGVLIIAKNNPTFFYFKKLFFSRKVNKRYLALVRGEINKEKGIIEFELTRSSTSGKRKIVLPQKGKSTKKTIKKTKVALTFYEVAKRYQGYTLLKVEPKTGRTHQIRIHLASIGFPVAGDKIYGPKGAPEELFKRQMLHAQVISFLTPQGKFLEIEAPIPQDFASALRRLLPIAKN
jgi:23S rRNA pseudouridine1911/1915/1917 synthase